MLMYHRVLSEEERIHSFSHEGIVVGMESFASQMEYLKDSFNVISLEEFLNQLPQKRFEKYSCLITFDDGWIDNYTNAYPVLTTNELPAVIFLPVDFIGTKKQFWREKVSANLFALCTNSSEDSRHILDKLGLDYLADQSPEQIKLSVQDYVSKLKKSSPEERALVLSPLTQFSDKLPCLNNNIDKFLSWGQVREMRDSGMSFGSHSSRHNILTELSLDDAAWEVSSSRVVINDKIGGFPRTFCYPNGDYSEQIVDIVARGGYDAAFSTKAGLVEAKDNPFTIKRVNIHEHMTRNTPLFLARLLGIF